MSEALDLSKLYYLLYLMMILFIFNHFNFPNHSMNDTRYFYQSFIKPRWAARLSAAHGSNQVAAVMRTKWRPDELCAEAEAEYDIFRYPVLSTNLPFAKFHRAKTRCSVQNSLIFPNSLIYC